MNLYFERLKWTMSELRKVVKWINDNFAELTIWAWNEWLLDSVQQPAYVLQHEAYQNGMRKTGPPIGRFTSPPNPPILSSSLVCSRHRQQTEEECHCWNTLNSAENTFAWKGFGLVSMKVYINMSTASIQQPVYIFSVPSFNTMFGEQPICSDNFPCDGWSTSAFGGACKCILSLWLKSADNWTPCMHC